MKLLETRRREGYTYRLYRLDDGTMRQTYEITDPSVTKRDIATLVRQARRAAVGRSNLVPNGSGIAGQRGISADPDKIDAILKDIEDPQLKVREVCAKHGISTKTYYRILRGA